MSFEKEAREHGVQRAKHLEDPNYRRLSNVFAISLDIESNYVGRLDNNMLACYLTCDAGADTRNVRQYIEENIDNSEINWRGLFAYLDERLACQPRLEQATIQRELIDFNRVLSPYRDKVCPELEFVGF